VESPIFSFSFKAPATEEGENLFSLGGLAGLKEEEIIWTDDKSQGRGVFQVDMPYISYNAHRLDLPQGHSVVVDTGCSVTVLPDEVLDKLWNWMKPQLFSMKFTFGKNTSVLFPGYDLRGLRTDQRPAMALRLGSKEWISEVVHTTATGQFLGAQGQGTGLFLSSVCPSSVFTEMIHREDIPSILGQQFWGNLKGLVFDFTPGKERVGMVPRVKLTNKSGLLNPMFVSDASD